MPDNWRPCLTTKSHEGWEIVRISFSWRRLHLHWIDNGKQLKFSSLYAIRLTRRGSYKLPALVPWTEGFNKANTSTESVKSSSRLKNLLLVWLFEMVAAARRWLDVIVAARLLAIYYNLLSFFNWSRFYDKMSDVTKRLRTGRSELWILYVDEFGNA